MADKGIIFSAPMVRALLDGTKTQTRRVLKPTYGTLEYLRDGTWRPIHTKVFPGDRLYVREAHALVPVTAYRMSDGVEQHTNPTDPDQAVVYREGWERCAPRWRPSIHMPRWASRITLTVTDVRVQRLAEITLGDCWAEGCMTGRDLMAQGAIPQGAALPFGEYRDLWNSLHGPDAWNSNPWVVASTFTVQRGNIDAVKP